MSCPAEAPGCLAYQLTLGSSVGDTRRALKLRKRIFGVPRGDAPWRRCRGGASPCRPPRRRNYTQMCEPLPLAAQAELRLEYRIGAPAAQAKVASLCENGAPAAQAKEGSLCEIGSP